MFLKFLVVQRATPFNCTHLVLLLYLRHNLGTILRLHNLCERVSPQGVRVYSLVQITGAHCDGFQMTEGMKWLEFSV